MGGGGEIQLSKRDNENKLNSITSGSSNGDGGVKEYYYKYNYDLDFSFSEFSKAVILTEVLYSTQDEVIPINKNITRYGVENILTLMVDQYCVAIKILDSEVIYFNFDSDNPFAISPKGSLIDKLLYAAIKAGIPEEAIKEYTNKIKSIFVEITKEEYESLITYKPE